MNIFKITEIKIIEIIKKAANSGKIIIPKDLKSINVESAPEKFDNILAAVLTIQELS